MHVPYSMFVCECVHRYSSTLFMVLFSLSLSYTRLEKGVASVHDSGSGSSVAEASPLSSPRHSQMVTNTFAVKRGPNGYGMIFKAIRVYIGQTNDYRIHHIIEVGRCV